MPPSFANVILFALAALQEQRSDSEVNNSDLARGLRSFATLRSVVPSGRFTNRVTKVVRTQFELCQRENYRS